jgi:hypothetical protein
MKRCRENIVARYTHIATTGYCTPEAGDPRQTKDSGKDRAVNAAFTADAAIAGCRPDSRAARREDEWERKSNREDGRMAAEESSFTQAPLCERRR